MNKKILKSILFIAICASMLVTSVSAAGDVLVADDFENDILNLDWRTAAASKCYVAVGEGQGIQGGNALVLNDNNDGTSSPYYEGFAEAMYIFTPQKGDMSAEFYFHSNNIPIGHEKVILGMGETVAFEMLLTNHGQNAHIRFNNAGKYELVTGAYVNMWHKAKIKLNAKNNTCEFYLDDMNECKISMKLTNPVEYIDRIKFETGEGQGEKSVFKIDNLVITGQKKTVEAIDAESSVEIKKGAYKKINAKAVPYDATDKSINYSSDNAKVASVDENGVVYGADEGTANITMTTADGTKKVCKVSVVKNTMVQSDVDFAYDYEENKIKLRGVSRAGEKGLSVLITEGENTLYLGMIEADADGKFSLDFPYTAKDNKNIDLAVKFSDGELVSKSLTYIPGVLQTTLSFEKEVYVSKLGQDEKLNVIVDTKAPERPVLTYGHGQKKVYMYGVSGYSSAYHVGTVKIDGENNYYTDNAQEGDYFVTVSSDEAVKASAKALVQVNDASATVEDTETAESRIIKVSLPAKSVAEKISDGKQVRLAAGYAEINLFGSTVPKENISFVLTKKNAHTEGAIAEYEISVSDNISSVPVSMKFPLDFLDSKISNYNLVSVYGSMDGNTWTNLKADVESGTNYMMVSSNEIYPFIQIRLNEDMGLNHFAKNEIYSLFSKSIYNKEQALNPDKNITKSEFAEAIQGAFKDCKRISGGNEYITRESAAAAIYDALGFKAQNTNVTEKLDAFNDGANVSGNCRTGLNTLCTYKVFNGDGKGNINPKNYITVGELAVVISRLK